MRALAFCLVLCACQTAPPPAPKDRLPSLPASPEGEVVATVNGRPITVDQVQAQARATKKEPKLALDDLVRAELLAQVADERGLFADPEVQMRAREEMVRHFLRGVFEKESTPDNVVTRSDLEKGYEKVKGRLVHPLLKEVDHILIMTPKRNEQNDKAAAMAEEIRRQALTTTSAQEFGKIADERAAAAKAIGCDIKSEHVVTAREGWTEEPFAKATFELKRPGEISAVAKTSYGYHVVRLQAEIPAENVSLEEAKPKLLEALYPKARTRAFQRYLEQAHMKHRVAVYPDRLSELQPVVAPDK